MKTYTISDASGLILEVHTTDEEAGALLVAPNGGQVLMSEPFTHNDFSWRNKCVVGGVLVNRVVMPILYNKTSFVANGSDEILLTGLPVGSVVRITGVVKAGPETITDGQLVLTSTKAGAINCTITCPPGYLDWSMAFDAT